MHKTRRDHLRGTIVAALAIAASAGAGAAPFGLDYIGEQRVATGSTYAGTTIGGLSGIDYDAATRQYWAISDDRSQVNDARFYTLTLDLAQFNRNADPGRAGVAFTGVTTLRDPSGAAFGNGQVDPESIRKVGDRLIWSSEGERSATSLQDPFLREMRLDGSYTRSYAVPSYYGTQTAGTGIRQNLAFESIAVSNDGATVYTATENALLQDGPAAAPGVGTPSRVLAFDRASGNPTGEYLYRTGPVAAAPQPPGSFATNGLVELLNVPGLDGSLLALERSFSNGVGFSIKLYLATFGGATDFAGSSTLPPGAQAMGKELLLDLGALGIALDNVEGVTWGPQVNGKQTLVLVSDNNFDGNQTTQFLAFNVTAVPEPTQAALLVFGLAGLAGAKQLSRRRSA